MSEEKVVVKKPSLFRRMFVATVHGYMKLRTRYYFISGIQYSSTGELSHVNGYVKTFGSYIPVDWMEAYFKKQNNLNSITITHFQRISWYTANKLQDKSYNIQVITPQPEFKIPEGIKDTAGFLFSMFYVAYQARKISKHMDKMSKTKEKQ